MQNLQTRKDGFTLVEFVIVMGVFSILFGVVWFNLSSFQQKTYLSTAVNSVVSDIKMQQVKAMNGTTELEGSAGGDFGVYFDDTTYTLFSGPNYVANNPTNFTISLESGVRFGTVLFPGKTVLFSSVSGEIKGYIEGLNSFTVTNTHTNEYKTLQFNRYGILTQLN